MTQFRALIAVKRGPGRRVPPGSLLDDLSFDEACELLAIGAIKAADGEDDGDDGGAGEEDFSGLGIPMADALAEARRDVAQARELIVTLEQQLASTRQAYDEIAAERDVLAARVKELEDSSGPAGPSSAEAADLPPVSAKLTEARLREIAAAEGVAIEDDANKATMVKLILAKREAA